MSQLITLTVNDLRILHRTGYVWATVGIFAVLLVLALQLSRLDFAGFADIVAAIILLDAVLTPVLIVGLMILLERGQGSFAVLAVTPMRRSAYLAARTLVVSVLGSAEMLLLTVVVYDGSLSIGLLVTGMLSLTAITSVSAVMIVSPFNSLYPFMLPMFGWIFLLGAPAYGVLLGWDPAWLAWHPTAPSMALLRSAFNSSSVETIVYGLAGTAIWLALFAHMALLALRRMQLQAAGA